MKKIIFLLLLLATIFFLILKKKDYPYELAICTMFKDEAPWLKEWIVYHHNVLGVEHFYLYNNDSTDDYLSVLEPFIEKGIVELTDWSSANEEHRILGYDESAFVPYQLGAFNDCIKKRALNRAKWVAVIDVDEFIVPVEGVDSFYAYLQKAERKKRGSIKLNWKVFGTSNIWELQPGQLLTEHMRFRAKDDYPCHRLTKCIHRPEAVKFCHVHDVELIDPNACAMHADHKKFRIHHYWTRTEKFCQQKRKMTKESHENLFYKVNEIEDSSILPLLPKLRQALL